MPHIVPGFGSGTVLTVRLSNANSVPPPNLTRLGFSVPPDQEKSNSVTGPKLNVSSTLVVVSRTKLSVPTVAAPDLAVIETVKPSNHAAAKSALTSVNGVGEVMLAASPPPLNPTFGELAKAVPYPSTEHGETVAFRYSKLFQFNPPYPFGTAPPVQRRLPPSGKASKVNASPKQVEAASNVPTGRI